VLAAWQSFFLVVPVVHVPFEAATTLFDGLGQGALGWLLVGGAERLTTRQARGLLGRAHHTVLTGDAASSATAMSPGRTGFPSALSHASALRIAERAALYGTWLRPDPRGRAGPADGAGRLVADALWVGTPLRVVRGVDRATIDLRNDLGYDGLLVSDRE
jgi:hypothetical protein